MMDKELEMQLYSSSRLFLWSEKLERTLSDWEFREGEAHPQATERIRQGFDARL